MNEPLPSDAGLEKRLAELELAAAELRRQMGRATPVLPPPLPPVAQSSPSPAQSPESREEKSSIHWFGRVGIGLLFIGLVLLFKLSIDEGWLTPGVRVAGGLLLGFVLGGYGWHLYGRRPALGSTLLGGAQAVFYVTLFAAHHWYDLLSYPVAFFFMMLVTVSGLFLALRFSSLTLALAGILGGYATPFLLYNGHDSVPGLVGYCVLIMSGAGILFWLRGWIPFLWTAVLGALAVLWFTYLRRTDYDTVTQVALQSGFSLWWLMFWLLPVFRAQRVEADEREALEGPVSVLVMLLPVVCLFFTAAIWSMSRHQAGGACVWAAVFYLGFWGLGRAILQSHWARLHLWTGLFLAGVGLLLYLKDNGEFFVFTALVLMLQAVSRRMKSGGWSTVAHLLHAGIAVWLAVRLFAPMRGSPFFNVAAWVDLFAVFSLLAVWWMLRSQPVSKPYWIAGQILALGWMAAQSEPLEQSLACISLGWGLYGFGLVLGGYWQRSRLITSTGCVILTLTVIKLLLVDLAAVAALWRVLLFLGFGGIFLLVSYLLDGRDRPTEKA